MGLPSYSHAFCFQCGLYDKISFPAGTEIDCSKCGLRFYTLPFYLKREELAGTRAQDLHEAYRQLRRAIELCKHSGRGFGSSCTDCSANWAATAIQIERANVGKILLDFASRMEDFERTKPGIFTAEATLEALRELAEKWTKGER